MAESVEQLEGWEDSDHSAYTDDEWHTHEGDMPPQYAHGTVSPAAIFAVGVGGLLSIVICVVLITTYFQMESQQEIALKQEVPMDAAHREMQSVWASEFSGYGWVDPQQGVIQIPLEKAVEKVAEAYAQQ